MKLFTIFVSIIGLFALAFLVSLFFPRSYHIEKSTMIAKPVQQTYDYLNNITYWKDWSPLDSSVDSTMTSFYSMIKSGPGASQYLSGNLIGTGRVRIVESVPCEKIHYNLHLYRNADMLNAEMTLLFKGVGDSTELTWVDTGDVGYNPVFRFLLPSKVHAAEETFEQGLRAIKLAAETRLK